MTKIDLILMIVATIGAWLSLPLLFPRSFSFLFISRKSGCVVGGDGMDREKDELEMQPKSFAETNTVFTLAGCNDLPAARANSPSGGSQVVTCWNVTDEQLDQIAETRCVWLIVDGVAPAPCRMTTRMPFAPTSPDEWPADIGEEIRSE